MVVTDNAAQDIINDAKSIEAAEGGNTKYEYKATQCLTGCIERLTQGCPGIVTPINTESMAPWVEVEFEGQDGIKITVGNQSAPNLQAISGVAHPNSAAIKSMEFGFADGMQTKIEIIDEQGGSFDMFFEKMVKCYSEASESYNMNLKFGWVGTKCYGRDQLTLLKMPENPWTLTFVPLQVDVTFEKGKVKYTVAGNDLGQVIFSGRETTTWGSDDHRLPLKEAIRQMFQTREPKLRAKFLRRTKGGRIKEWKFPNAEGSASKKGEGPVNPYRCNNENKIVAANKWIVEAGATTDEQKGITCTWESINEDGKPTIIFWEDPTPPCDEAVDCSKSLGTFIVNGGKCSNVISFKPTINFAAHFNANLAGGGVGGAQTSETIERENEKPGCGKVQTKSTGISGEITPSTNAQDTYGKRALQKKEESQRLHNQAGALRQQITAIQAELVILGNPNPEYVDITRVVQRFCSIVVINPFSLGRKNKGKPGEIGHGKHSALCGDWLADPICNELLSNKAWQIQGIHHSIREGSYTTTLKLFLAATEGRPLGNDPNAPIRKKCPEGD